jgi:hypothetical protein
LAHGISSFHVVFDVIASGDEDVVVSERAQAIRDQTGAACVAWEGTGRRVQPSSTASARSKSAP